MSTRVLLHRPWSAVVFRLLLTISLWQGPFPLLHQHVIGEPGLTTHLARYHAGQSTNVDLGWHWHLFYPDAGDLNDPVEPKDSSPLRLPRVVMSSASCLMLAALSLEEQGGTDITCVLTSLNVTLPGGEIWTCGHSYLTTFDFAHALRQIVCRMNC